MNMYLYIGCLALQRSRYCGFIHKPLILLLYPEKRNAGLDGWMAYLRQAGKDGGAAGRTAADGGEGVPEYEAALGKGPEVRGVNSGVVVHLSLEARVVGCDQCKMMSAEAGLTPPTP